MTSTSLTELIEERRQARQPVVLEIGAGSQRREPGSITIDQVPSAVVDVVEEIGAALAAVPTRSVDTVHAHHVLEHLPDLESTLREVWRILRPTGRFLVSVPHFSNPYYYSDYTHRQPFGLYTFAYFMNESDQPARKVPTYCAEPRFRAASTRIVFRVPLKEWRPTLAGRALTWLFNRSSRAQEAYEARLCFLIPCHELRFDLRPVHESPQ